MRVIFVIVGLVLILISSGCVSNSSGKPGIPETLTTEQFTGHTLSLISDTDVEWYKFAKDRVVLTNLGKRHGIIMAPALYWRIVDGHTLTITDTPEGQHTMIISYEFRWITDKYAVTMDGKQFERE